MQKERVVDTVKILNLLQHRVTTDDLLSLFGTCSPDSNIS